MINEMKLNRGMKKYGKYYSLFRFLNEIHAILRLFSRSLKIKGYDNTKPFFRTLYRRLRQINNNDDLQAIYELAPSLTELKSKTYVQQIKKIRYFLDYYAKSFHMESEYHEVKKYVSKIEGFFIRFSKQKQLEDFIITCIKDNVNINEIKESS